MKNSKMFMMVGVLMVVVLLGAVLVGGGGMMGKLSKGGAVTRAELVAMLASPLSMKLNDNLYKYNCNPFFDVDLENTSMREKNSICYFFEKGLVQGSAGAGFKPKTYVNRAESAKLFWLVYSLAGGDVGKNFPEPAYTDITENDWYYTYIQSGAGIKNDVGVGIWEIPAWDGKNFHPAANLTNAKAKLWINKLKEALNYV